MEIKKYLLPSFFTFFITLTAFYICCCIANILIVNDYTLDYYIFFYGVKIAPNIMFILLILKYLKIPESITNSTSALFFLSAEILLIYFTFHFLMSIPIEEIISYWSYQAIITWCASLLLFSYYFGKRWNDNTLSLTLSFFAVHFAGFLYEIPIYHYMSGLNFFHITNPLILSPNVVSLFLLLFSIKLHRFKWKSDRLFKYALIFFSAFSIVYFFKPFLSLPFNGWLPRIPTLFLLFAFLHDLKVE